MVKINSKHNIMIKKLRNVILSSVMLVTFIAVSSLTLPQQRTTNLAHAPALFTGKFTDDYGITYTISDTLWIQHPRTKFHIIRWNLRDQYLIARNDTKNPGDGGLYTRIDIVQFDNMQPWLWGYCLTAYQAPTDQAAEATAAADRKNPRKGCNGYPFSRMKRIE
jgi:hypothetical protein